MSVIPLIPLARSLKYKNQVKVSPANEIEVNGRIHVTITELLQITLLDTPTWVTKAARSTAANTATISAVYYSPVMRDFIQKQPKPCTTTYTQLWH